jgi:hypothetical protein
MMHGTMNVKRGTRMCMHMRYVGFKPAISVDIVNNFSVSYSQTTTAALHNLYANNLQQPTANNHTAVPADPVHC